MQTILHLLKFLSLSSKSSNKKCGTWVLLPLPVSPATTTTRCFLRVSTMECLCLNTGNCSLSFKSLWYFGVLCSFLKRALVGSKSSIIGFSRESPLKSSSEAKFSQESSASSGILGLLSSCCCGCCCLSLFKSLAINWSRGLLVSILFSSSFFFSVSLHSNHTSLYVGGSNWWTDCRRERKIRKKFLYLIYYLKINNCSFAHFTYASGNVRWRRFIIQPYSTF